MAPPPNYAVASIDQKTENIHIVPNGRTSQNHQVATSDGASENYIVAPPGVSGENYTVAPPDMPSENYKVAPPGGSSENHPVAPPDGGWGWLIVAAIALQWFFQGGMIRAFSLVFQQMRQRYDATAAEAAVVYSINISLTLMASPVAAALSARMSARRIVAAGTLLTFSGMLFTGFAPSMVWIYFSYGVVSGVGSGLVSTMRYIVLRHWFREKLGRALAMSLMTDGLGTMAISPFIEFSFRHYGYSGTMMLVAAFSLHGLVIATAMVPPPSTAGRGQKEDLQGSSHSLKQLSEGDNVATPRGHEVLRLRTKSQGSLEDWDMCLECEIRPDENHQKADDQLSILKGTGVDLRGSARKLNVNEPSSATYVDYKFSHRSLDLPSAFDTPSYTPTSTPLDTSIDTPLEASLEDPSETTLAVVSQPSQDTPSDSALGKPCGTSSPTFSPQPPVGPSPCPAPCARLGAALLQVVNVPLLRGSRYLCYSVLMTCSSLASSMSNTHLAGMAAERAITARQVALLLAVIGAVAIVTKVLAGVVFDLRAFRPARIPVFAIFGMAGGLALTTLPLTSGVAIFYTYWVVHAIIVSVVNTQESLVLNEIVAQDSYPSAIGLSRFCRGVGVLVGPTVGGLLQDTTGSYTSTFYFGGLLLFSSSALFEANYLRRRYLKPTKACNSHIPAAEVLSEPS